MVVKDEYFSLIEQAGSRGISAREIAEHTGSVVHSVSVWLSKWVKYGYLVKFKVDPEKLSGHDRLLHDEEVKKERDIRWVASHRLENRVSRRGCYSFSRYRYRIDETCKEWGARRYGDHSEDVYT